MKTIFAKDLQPGPSFDDCFLVVSSTARTTKSGKPYCSLELRDRTGAVKGNIWDLEVDANGHAIAPPASSFIKVRAAPSEYKGEMQLTISQWRALDDSEVSIEDFLPVSQRDRDKMLSLLYEIIETRVHDATLMTILHSIVAKHSAAIRDAPAAKGNHQAYIGGLLEHILNLCDLAMSLKTQYTALDRDLLIAAAILHDVGKVYELRWARSIDYTRRGRLTGHVVIGLQMLHEAIGDSGCATHSADLEKLDHLEHIIASHHGLREWGATQVPLSREASVFHLLDMIDSRMGNFDALADKPRDADGFTLYMQTIGGPIFVPRGEDA